MKVGDAIKTDGKRAPVVITGININSIITPDPEQPSAVAIQVTTNSPIDFTFIVNQPEAVDDLVERLLAAKAESFGVGDRPIPPVLEG